MKNLLYQFIVKCNNITIILIKNVCLFLVTVFAWIFNKLLVFIDKERLNHNTAVDEQYNELYELQILTGIKNTRDDALKAGHWNSEHEQLLNHLGNVLANTCDWEVDSVEEYLLQVIETGPIQE